MGYYVNVISKPGCEDQINDLWHRAFGEDYLIMTEERIERGIADLHVDPQFSHLKSVKTVEDWENVYPIFARRLGQVFLAPAEDSDDESDGVEPLATLQAKVAWLQSNRLLFDEIRNLQDAADSLGLTYDFDGYEQGREVTYDRPDFARLPSEPNNKVYNRCLSLDNPSLWERFLAFREDPCTTTWNDLKSAVVPTEVIGGETIWQFCEKLESQRTGNPTTLYGVYGGDRVPPMTDVVRAILNWPDVQRTPKEGQGSCP